MSKKRIFIGDVQGCADELEDLLEALMYDKDLHELYFVGDLINRGPASARTLRRVMALNAQSVLGNHDLHAINVLNGTRALKPLDTFQDLLQAPDCDELISWLRNRPLIIEWDDVILVHAGLHPKWTDLSSIARPLEQSIRNERIPFQDANLRMLTFVRYCDPNGKLLSKGQKVHPPYAPWDHFYKGDRTVVCGHWAARGLVQNKYLQSIDTGCVWGGRLTAWIAEENRIVSVPARKPHQKI